MKARARKHDLQVARPRVVPEAGPRAQELEELLARGVRCEPLGEDTDDEDGQQDDTGGDPERVPPEAAEFTNWLQPDADF